MQTGISKKAGRRNGWLVVGAVLAVLIPPLVAQGLEPKQSEGPHSARAPEEPTTSSGSLVDQIRELQSQVAALEAALAQRHESAATHTLQQEDQAMMPMSPMQGMEMMAEAQGMMSGTGMTPMQGMASMNGDGMGMAGIQSMSGAGSATTDRGMSMMGRMRSAAQNQMTSALPGFPGASHIYHVGATGFFLDHPEHITLSVDQQVALNRIKERTLLDQATAERRIEEAEQELWMLTASDQPDAEAIEAKVREIEMLQGDLRLAFIRAVGEAAKLLTDVQRTELLGTVSGDHASRPSGG